MTDRSLTNRCYILNDIFLSCQDLFQPRVTNSIVKTAKRSEVKWRRQLHHSYIQMNDTIISVKCSVPHQLRTYLITVNTVWYLQHTHASNEPTSPAPTITTSPLSASNIVNAIALIIQWKRTYTIYTYIILYKRDNNFKRTGRIWK